MIIRRFRPVLSILLPLFLFCVAAGDLRGQSTPILITTNAIPPYDPDLSVWERNPDRVQVTLRNTSTTETFSVRIAGFAEGLDNGVRVEIKNDFPTDPIVLAPSAVITLNARQTNLFDPNAVVVTGADRDAIAQTRQLPEGDYRICLRALDFTTLESLSAEAPAGCASFGIKAGELPRLFAPACDEEVRALKPQFMLFQWTRPSLNVPPTALANLRFTFVLVPIEDDRSPEEALESAADPIFLEADNLGGTFYQLGPADPRLELGQRYAWRVQVSDPVDGTAFENDGWSEACSFTWGSNDQEEEDEIVEEPCAPPLVSVHFPNNRNSAVPVPRLPYRFLPVVANYVPFCPNLKSFASILNIREGTKAVQSWSRTYTWEKGLLDSLREEEDDPFVLDEQLLTPTVVDNASTLLVSAPSVSGLRPLPPGVPLEWQVHVTTRTPDDIERRTTKTGRVSVGLDDPIPEFPRDGARLKKESLRFAFTTSERPADSLLRPFLNVLAAERSRGGTVPSIPVKEIWMLEVARTPFTDPAGTEVLYSRFGTVSSSLSLNGKSAKSKTITPTVLQEIYTSISVSSGLEAEEGEQYYWRVKWLVDNQTTVPRSLTINDTAAYAWSRVSGFTIDGNAGDGDEISDAECLRIIGRVPSNGGLWEGSMKPQFSVEIEPEIDAEKITGARLQVWRLDTDAEKSRPTSVLDKPADFDHEVTGSVGSGTFMKPTTNTTTGQTLYDLLFVNHPGSSKDFVGVDGEQYAWRVTLTYDKVTIRTDGVACTGDAASSSLATFRIDASIPDVSPDTCFILSPTTPEFGSKIRTAEPTFAVAASPPIDPAGITGVTLEIWKMRRATERPVDVVKRTPAFRTVLHVSDPAATTLDIARHLQVILDSGTIKTPIGLTFVNGRNALATFVAEYDTNYLWQVTLDVDPQKIRLDGVVCTPTEVRSAYGTFRRDTTSGNSDCPNSCSIDPPQPPLPRDTVPTISLDPARPLNGTVTVGRFTLTLESITEGSTADNLSGEGTINIPFMRKMDVAVEFTGLRVNARREVYAGVVNVQRTENTPVPTGSGDALGMNNDEIRLAYAAATDGTRLLSNVVTGEAMMLPIGFDNEVDGERMTIGIVDMVFRPTGAYLAAVFSYPLPQFGPDVGIGLGARNICFSPTGMGGDSRRELYLAADLEFKQDDSWGFRVKAPTSEGGFVSDSGTYVAWDCNGFQAMRLRADVYFPRSWMLPITPEGEVDPDPTSLVTGSFATTVRKGAHWIASASLTPFAPASMPDLHFAVETMVIDQSDLENEPTMVFPPEYRGDMTTGWRGFALQSGRVRLPEALRTFDTGEPPAISVKGMMIDKSGITGTLSVANLIPYPQGNFAGWAGGIDTVSIRFVSNSFAEGSFAGKIGLPITKEGVGYSASFAYSQQTKTPTFTLNLKPQETLTVPLWVADLKLNSTATIRLTKAPPEAAESTSITTTTTTTSSTSTPASSRPPQTKWVISATLTGDINVAGDAGAVPGLSVSGLHFEGVGVKSVAPYLLPGTWSLAGYTFGEGMVEEPPSDATGREEPSATATTGDPAPQPGVAGFPLSITDIGPIAKIEDGKTLVGLEFKVVVNLMGGPPDAPTGFSGATGIELWGELKTEGGQKFDFSHATLASIAIDANFGPTAHVKGVVEFYERNVVYGTGFYGGLEVNVLNKFTAKAIVQIGSVKQDGEDVRYWFVDMQALLYKKGDPKATGYPIGSTGLSFLGAGGGLWYKMSRSGNDPDPQRAPQSDIGSLAIGQSLSGSQYVPDSESDFGFKLGVTIGTNKPEVFNSDLGISVTIVNGGLGEVSLEGWGYMMAGLHERERAIVKMSGSLSYRPQVEEFEGSFYLDVSQPLYSARGPVHFFIKGGEDWHLKFGEPGDEIGVTFLGFLKGTGYMMIGNRLVQLGSQLVPGIAFGAGVGVKIDQSVGPFSGTLDGRAKFDAVLRKGGEYSECEGINGWYGLGTIEAWLHAKIGVRVKIPLIGRRTINFINASVKASLTGGMPKPFWASGKLNIKFSVLGGLASGTCKFGFSIGNECAYMIDKVENPLADKELIESILPADGNRGVDLGVTPEVEFSLPVGTTLEVLTLASNGLDSLAYYKIVPKFLLSTTLGSSRKVEEIVVNHTATDKASIYPLDLLESESLYELTIIATVDELHPQNRTWSPSRRLDGSLIADTLTSEFTTDRRPIVLMPSNIATTIPIENQRFYTPNGAPGCLAKGQIVLRRGTPYLLEEDSGEGADEDGSVHRGFSFADLIDGWDVSDEAADESSSMRLRVRFTNVADGSDVYSDAEYVDIEEREPRHIVYTVPDLSPGTIYRLELQRMIGEGNKNIDILYSYHFRTSRFSTMKERLDNVMHSITGSYTSGHAVELRNGEGFDVVDFQQNIVEFQGREEAIVPIVVDHFKNYDIWYHNNVDRQLVPRLLVYDLTIETIKRLTKIQGSRGHLKIAWWTPPKLYNDYNNDMSHNGVRFLVSSARPPLSPNEINGAYAGLSYPVPIRGPVLSVQQYRIAKDWHDRLNAGLASMSSRDLGYYRLWARAINLKLGNSVYFYLPPRTFVNTSFEVSVGVYGWPCGPALQRNRYENVNWFLLLR